MSIFSAVPRVWVDIYPYEGGQYSLSGFDANLRTVSSWKNIETGDGGFVLNLAPGGPNGINASPSWTDIITPMSLVVIGMQRHGFKQIVMIGYAKDIIETTEWTPQGVLRGISIEGPDFQGIFRDFYYYTLSYLGSTQGATLGPAGLASIVSASLLGPLSPATIAQNWYQKIMSDPGAVLGNLQFQYRGSGISFGSLMSTWFEQYPNPVQIPFAASFIGDEDTWQNKMRSFLPFPWYEFFVITAPIGTYGPAAPAASLIDMEGFLPASPTLVARVNPLPYTPLNGGVQNPSFDFDMTRWLALPTYELDNHGFLSSNVGYDASLARNYYVIDPLWIGTMYGDSASTIAAFQNTFASWVDPASVDRYGYKPCVMPTAWFPDLQGGAAQQNTANGTAGGPFANLVADLSMRVTSYYEPLPLMLQGEAVINLRPDIMPGSRFVYAPRKSQRPWMFYIEGVRHTFTFGGTATTSLQITRGLPVSDWEDEVLLKALHTGNAQRFNGHLRSGLPNGALGLQVLDLQSQQQILGQLAQIFVTPGAR